MKINGFKYRYYENDKKMVDPTDVALFKFHRNEHFPEFSYFQGKFPNIL